MTGPAAQLVRDADAILSLDWVDLGGSLLQACTRPIFVKTGRVLKLRTPMMVRSILFPAAVPEIFTGLRVGFSLTLIGTVLGEMFASQHGLGHVLMNAIGLYNVEVIMAVTFLLVAFAAGVNGILLAIDRRLHFRG